METNERMAATPDNQTEQERSASNNTQSPYISTTGKNNGIGHCPTSLFVDKIVHIDYNVCTLRFTLDGEFIKYYCHSPPRDKALKTDV